MSRTVPLQVSGLEEREVPAAGLFADIMPGVWGSYPLNLTPSGSTLFFSADNGHGYELYATDGTPGSARMVKDIKPGLGGSNPTNFVAAGNGVVYFAADDGTGAAVWRSDGTAAGTAKLAGIPLDAVYAGVGSGGDLFYLASQGSITASQWWKANGSGATLLKDFGPVPDGSAGLSVRDGKVLLTWTSIQTGAVTSVWQTDGTAAGTRAWQQNLTATDPSTGPVQLDPGVELSPGRFVYPSRVDHGTTSVWVGDGQNPAATSLLKAFDASPYTTYIDGGFVRVGGKLYFLVGSNSTPRPAVVGLWATDGTAAGTRKVDLPVGPLVYPVTLQVLNGQLLVHALDPATGAPGYWLTDGTAAGTRPVRSPAGTAANLTEVGPTPQGAIAFSDQGRLFLTDGTPGGTAWVDTAGLPQGLAPAAALRGSAGLGGSVYFSAGNGSQRPELWKWDLGGPTQPAPAAIGPKVTGVVVNDGSAQRSVVNKLTVTFDRVVDLADGAVGVKDTSGRAVLLYLDPETVGGKTVLTITFGGAGVVGGSIPDGRYTLTFKAGNVTDATTGGAMAADYTFGFTRLYGDLDGDGTYDRASRWTVHISLGLRAGDPGYIAALDVNSDGVIDGVDELAVVRNWGKSV